jgi:hypothetical protein
MKASVTRYINHKENTVASFAPCSPMFFFINKKICIYQKKNLPLQGIWDYTIKEYARVID